MLHELLKIKKIRENSANDEVRKCKEKLKNHKQELLEKEKELQEYLEWRRKEEQTLYDNIINTEVRQNALDQLKQKISILREKDVTLEESISEAKKKVSDSEKELESAKEVFRKALQAVQKFEEFTKVLDEDAAKETARLADLEMEEFTVRSKE